MNAVRSGSLVILLLLSCYLRQVSAQSGAPVSADAATPVRPAAPTKPASPDNSSSPRVRIVDPQDRSTVTGAEVLVQVEVMLPGGASLLALRALIDGRVAAQVRGLKLAPTPVSVGSAVRNLHLLTVPVPPQDTVLTVVAETTQGKSPAASCRLRFARTAESSEQPALLQPRLFLLSIGVSSYRQGDLRLRFAAKDAQDLAQTFKNQQKVLYRSVEARVLTDEQATRNNIVDSLEWLQRTTTNRDVAVLFLAGHGVTDPGTGTYYYLPYDADPEAMRRTMVPESEFRTTLANIAGKAILFLDTCHSGKVYAGTTMRSLSDLGGFIGELASADTGVVVFAASTGRQASQESPDWNNGAFTKAVVEGLRGRADLNKTGRITLNMLDLYVSERVKALTQGRQTPTTAKPSTIADFPLAVAREVNDEDVELAR